MPLGVTLFGRRFELTTKAALPIRSTGSGGGWWPVIREPFTGAWQQNAEVRPDTSLSYFAVFACTTLIASDIGKLRLRLVEQDEDGVWEETSSPAFSPVLRKPNDYQNIIKFVEQWIVSKLVHGNAYVIKQRDERNVVVALYVLDPLRVTPLVTEDGAVYYELSPDPLSGLAKAVVVPAREIIHDPMVCLFHPLCGVSPLYAAGLATSQGLKMQDNSAQFFGNASKPSGVITVPGAIDKTQAGALKADWELNFSGPNVGRVAILSAGMEYHPITVSAADAQLIEQSKWAAETICSAYHVPPYMIGVGPPPPYANIEPLLQQYYSQCLQSLITSFELCLDEGLELPTPYGTEFDIDDLIWMDTATRTAAAKDSIGSGALSPDEARFKYFGVGPVKGGDTPYLQEQYHSLAALAVRDVATPPSPLTALPVPAPAPAPAEDGGDQTAALIAALHRKTLRLDDAA